MHFIIHSPAMLPLRRAIIILLPLLQTFFVVVGLHFQNIYVFPLLQTDFFAVDFKFQNIYAYSAIAGLIVSDVLIALFFKKSISRSKIFWYALPPLLLYCSAVLALMIVEESYLIGSIIGTHALFQWLYLINLYFFLYKKERYQERSFLQMTMSLHTLSFLFFSIAAFGLIYYVDYSTFIVIIPVCFLGAVGFAQQLVIGGFDIRQYWRFLGIQTLIIAEIMLVISWFPSPYLTKAFFLTVPLFLSCQLGYPALRKELDNRFLLHTILLTVCVVLLVVMTTRWT